MPQQQIMIHHGFTRITPTKKQAINPNITIYNNDVWIGVIQYRYNREYTPEKFLEVVANAICACELQSSIFIDCEYYDVGFITGNIQYLMHTVDGYMTISIRYEDKPLFYYFQIQTRMAETYLQKLEPCLKQLENVDFVFTEKFNSSINHEILKNNPLRFVRTNDQLRQQFSLLQKMWDILADSESAKADCVIDIPNTNEYPFHEQLLISMLQDSILSTNHTYKTVTVTLYHGEYEAIIFHKKPTRKGTRKRLRSGASNKTTLPFSPFY